MHMTEQILHRILECLKASALKSADTDVKTSIKSTPRDGFHRQVRNVCGWSAGVSAHSRPYEMSENFRLIPRVKQPLVFDLQTVYKSDEVEVLCIYL